jgi:predicted transcriptional regulator
MNTKHASTFVRFLSATNATTLPCDLVARALLHVIAARGDDHMTVTEVMAQSAIASPASLHRKLDDLIAFGLVTLTHRGANRRTKYVVPTKVAEAYFHTMGKAMIEAGAAA